MEKQIKVRAYVAPTHKYVEEWVGWKLDAVALDEPGRDADAQQSIASLDQVPGYLLQAFSQVEREEFEIVFREEIPEGGAREMEEADIVMTATPSILGDWRLRGFAQDGMEVTSYARTLEGALDRAHGLAGDDGVAEVRVNLGASTKFPEVFCEESVYHQEQLDRAIRHHENVSRLIIDSSPDNCLVLDADHFEGAVSVVGSSRVILQGNATAAAWSNAEVTATQESFLTLNGFARAVATGDSVVVARQNSLVIATDHALVEAHDRASVYLFDKARVELVEGDASICYRGVPTLRSGVDESLLIEDEVGEALRQDRPIRPLPREVDESGNPVPAQADEAAL